VAYGSKNPKKGKKLRDAAMANGWVIEPNQL
jgi:hypothetical protein